ncbi:MAG TPA: DUF721 domain-containing protein [Bryobacteraceae bacterium]|nr:DUF721 domain-containing protein [Bryobacteraceae bacterium]
MDQASLILAKWTTPSDTDESLVTRERLVLGSWKKAVGKRLSDRARALKLVRDRLVVGVDDEVWQRNLRGLRFQIMKNLEAAVGPGLVKEIEFRVLPRRIEPQRAGLDALVAPDESDNIADPGLRRIYRNSRRRETA